MAPLGTHLYEVTLMVYLTAVGSCGSERVSTASYGERLYYPLTTPVWQLNTAICYRGLGCRQKPWMGLWDHSKSGPPAYKCINPCRHTGILRFHMPALNIRAHAHLYIHGHTLFECPRGLLTIYNLTNAYPCLYIHKLTYIHFLCHFFTPWRKCWGLIW